jgi:hypothetical protein
MKVRPKIKWMLMLSFFLALSAFLTMSNLQAQPGFVGTQTCIDCHSTWQDNNPSTDDLIKGNAIVNVDYVPLNLLSTHAQQPFYTIPEAYVSSIHNIPSFNLTLTDEVRCEGCHGSGLAHFGVGPIPTPIPGISTCGKCHNETPSADTLFPLKAFLSTLHANPENKPGKFFDQRLNGLAQGTTSSLTPGFPGIVSLFKSDKRSIVTRNERIEECSVCHNYALNYPQFVKKIAQNNMPRKPTVSCGACHDAHIPSPDGNEPAVVDGPVQVTGMSGSTITAVTSAPGSEFYLNHKPYKLAANGAQDTINGVWTRGSAIARPNISIVKGVGTLSVSNGSNILTFPGGGFQGNVQPFNTLLISGVASASVNLPADAINAGAPVTVQATFDRNGFQVVGVSDDNTLVFTPAPTATATVTYKKTAGGTGTLSVPITFTGSVNFDVRDMYTNTQNLCGSCHTQGKFKFSAWGKRRDGTLIDVSNTHNNDILTQYLTSGHADRLAPAFVGFTAFGGHKIIYPHDQSITGTGGVGSLRNRSNTAYQLTQTPNPANAYLSVAGNTTLPLVTSTSFACNQCHQGLGSIDFQNNVQGTMDARVLWGDSTVTCWTCHNPHVSQIDANVRIPVKLSINTTYFADPVKNPNGGINKFMDGTDIPSNVGNGIICLFCHQGRESGLTVFLNIKKNTPVDPYTNPDARLTGINSFQNPHYLESGAILWAKNNWEYIFGGTPQTYSSGIAGHQQENCMGCHMGEASANGLEGGHTWRPRIETCQKCHGSVTNFQDILASADWDGNGKRESAFLEIGAVIDPVAGTGNFGLMGQLRQALAAKGIFYNPNGPGQYFFTSEAFTTQFTNWTTNTLTAAFNLSFLYKAGNCRYVHNPFYSAQILQDSLRALGVTPTGVRPTGDRNATDYRVTQNNINP